MGALIFGTKMALVSIPNVHLNAVLIILTAVFFGWKVLYSVAVYIMLEGLVFGFGMWWACYWYLWPILAITAVLLRKVRSSFIWALVAGIHGLSFGALCSVPFIFISGWRTALAYWINGIPFDITHCVGNFVVTLLLFKPLYTAMSSILGRAKIKEA